MISRIVKLLILFPSDINSSVQPIIDTANGVIDQAYSTVNNVKKYSDKVQDYDGKRYNDIIFFTTSNKFYREDVVLVVLILVLVIGIAGIVAFFFERKIVLNVYVAGEYEMEYANFYLQRCRLRILFPLHFLVFWKHSLPLRNDPR